MTSKKYQLKILESAELEIEEIAKVHYQLVGPISAKKITDVIYTALEQLELFPLSGVEAPDKYMRKLGYRVLICKKYLCIYRLIDSVVYVYHIVYGASEYPGLFKEKKTI